MSTDPQSQVMGKYNALQSRARRLISEATLAEAVRDVSDTTADVAKLPGELERARSRGYAFASYLERKVQVLSQQWDAQRRELYALIEQEAYRLREEGRQVESLLSSANSQAGNPFALTSILPDLEREVNDLDTKVKSAELRVKARFSALDREVSQTVEQVQDIHGYLDQQEEASFPFLAGEKVFLAAHGEWVATGKGGQDPDGILFLTDQRLVFEQKEKTGKKLGLFGGKHTQELEWEVPLHRVEKVEAENKGLFGGKDFLHFTLSSGAPYIQITVEVKGKAKCKFWAAQIQRMARGETSDERAIPPDPELLEMIRTAPTACHVCGATLPILTAGQLQIECRYCGSVIRLGGQTAATQSSAREPGTSIVKQDIEVYAEPDVVVPHGILKQGAVVRVNEARFRGKAPYTLVSGEGPASGWVGVHAIILGESE